MNIEQLQSLVKQGESDTLEFKTSTRELRGVFETACAFLNNQGGTVLIGVGDNKKIIGQQISDQTKKDIATEIVKIEPSAQAQINIKYVSVDCDKQVIVLEIGKGNHAPYAYDGRSFIRAQSTTNRMSQHRYEQLIVERGQLNHSWENAIVDDFSIKDLDDNLIKKTIKLAVQKGRLTEDALVNEPLEILRRFNLIYDDKITRAAVILFCKDEHKHFVQSQLRLARFRGGDKSEFIDNKKYIGNLFYLYDKAMTFFSNYLPIEGKVVKGKPDRIDEPAIPYIVLREAIINALCHRDYSVHGGAISIAIYDDRVEISNMGTLPQGVDVEDLTKAHLSIPRNPIIADVLYVAGYIEMWGRGTQNIISFSKAVKNPDPIFIATKTDFTVRLPLRKPILSSASTQQLTARQSDILKILEKNHNPMKASELMVFFSDISNIRTIQREILNLQKLGLIESIGKGRNTTWRVIN